MLTKLEKARLLLLVKNEIDELKKIVSEAEKFNYCDTDIAHINKSINEYSILYKKVNLMECE